MKTLPLTYYLAFFAGSFLLSLVLTPLVRRLALATGKIASPKDNRWHKKDTALFGGMSIFVSFTCVWFLAQYFIGWKPYDSPFYP